MRSSNRLRSTMIMRSSSCVAARAHNRGPAIQHNVPEGQAFQRGGEVLLCRGLHELKFIEEGLFPVIEADDRIHVVCVNKGAVC